MRLSGWVQPFYNHINWCRNQKSWWPFGYFGVSYVKGCEKHNSDNSFRNFTILLRIYIPSRAYELFLREIVFCFKKELKTVWVQQSNVSVDTFVVAMLGNRLNVIYDHRCRKRMCSTDRVRKNDVCIRGVSNVSYTRWKKHRRLKVLPRGVCF